MQFLRWFYGLLLNLFPGEYREGYAEELQAVFYLSLDAAGKKGRWELIRVILWELFCLPGAIIFEHLRERRKTNMLRRFGSHFNFVPDSRSETLAALAPFLLLGALPTLFSYFSKLGLMPGWLSIIFTLFMLVSVVSLFVLGFIQAVPRWFIPHPGLPLPLLSVYGIFGLISGLINFPNHLYGTSWFLGQLVFQGLLSAGMFLLIVLLLLVTGLIPGLRLFYRRLRADWTLLCFILYGMAPFALVFTFDYYINEEPYLILAFLILAAGGWFYLRSTVPWKRFLALIGGLALSMLSAAVGKASLYSGPWPRPQYFTWQTELMSTIIMWMWLAMIMLVPLALKLLPPSSNSSPATSLFLPRSPE